MMNWGQYLCYGVSTDPVPLCEPVSPEKIIAKLELALRELGLSKFSSSIAVQFIASKLRSGQQDTFARAVSYLLSLLNKRDVGALNDIRSTSVFRCPQLIPGLRGQPFWDTAQLPWIAKLEASYGDIKREFLALKEGGQLGAKESGFQHYRSPKASADENTNDVTQNNNGAVVELGESVTDRGQWNVCYFYLHGMDFADNLDRCPITAEAIDSVPRQYHHALFSALAPDTHVKPHCGPTNKKLRCHLPLHIPGCPQPQKSNVPEYSGFSDSVPSTPWLRVGDQYCALQEGKCVVFDDSFEHEACNPSLTEPRVVLIVDFWHPDLSNEEVNSSRFLRIYMRI